jgi:hypothetical protein
MVVAWYLALAPLSDDAAGSVGWGCRPLLACDRKHGIRAIAWQPVCVMSQFSLAAMVDLPATQFAPYLRQVRQGRPVTLPNWQPGSDLFLAGTFGDVHMGPVGRACMSW